MSVNSFTPPAFGAPFDLFNVQNGSGNSPLLHTSPQLEPLKEDLAKFIIMINAEDKTIQLEGLIAIRKLLSLKDNPPIQEIIASGVVPKLLEFMRWDNEEKFQFESAWAVTNICSGTSQDVEYVVGLGGLDIIVDLLDSNSIDVLDQAVWALGNIAGDNTSYRNLCLVKGAMDKLVAAVMKFPHNPSLKRNGIWALSNLVRGKPIPQWDQIATGVSVFRNVIAETQFDEALIDALWGVSWSSETYIQEVIDLGCVPFLAHHLKNNQITVLIPTLRALGNIVTGDDIQTTTVLECEGFLPRIFELTSNPKKNVRKEACWLISNIAAGNQNQIAMILESPHYFESLKKVLFQDLPEVVTEAAWALGNLASGASQDQIRQMVNEYDYAKCLYTMLTNPSPKVLQIGLEATRNVLNAGDDGIEKNKYVQTLNSEGLVAKLELLLSHSHANLADLAQDILIFFDEAEELEEKEKDDKNEEKNEQKEEEEGSVEDEEEDEDEEDDEKISKEENEDGEDQAYQNLERED